MKVGTTRREARDGGIQLGSWLRTTCKLDKLVETERAAGKNFAADEVFKVALKLKSRAP